MTDKDDIIKSMEYINKDDLIDERQRKHFKTISEVLGWFHKKNKVGLWSKRRKITSEDREKRKQYKRLI